jgi:hypothetical protein
MTLKNDLTYRMFKAAKQFLGKAYNTAKLFTKAIRPTNIVKAISNTVSSISNQYPPQVKRMLNEHGPHQILDVRVCKEVVSKNTEFLMKALSAPGQWEEAKRKNGFDKFYHLFIIVKMPDGYLHIEKNEVMRVSETPRPCPDGLDLGAPAVPTTIGEMMEKTRQRVGDNEFFTYDPFSNNCQNFISNLLQTIGLYNQTAKSFVYQDINGLKASLPSLTRKLARGLTDVGAFFNTAYQKTKDYIENGSQGQGQDQGLDYQTDAAGQ